MLWTESALIAGDQLGDIGGLAGEPLTVAPPSPGPRRLLVHVTIAEDQAGDQRYVALTALAVQPQPDGREGVAALEPVLDLTDAERHALRGWLIQRRWPAWARASHHVRELLGASEPPVSLAEAARSWRLPLSTLVTAVAQGRLPAIAVADRRLVYASAVGEALDRGMLHTARGRPRRRGRGV